MRRFSVDNNLEPKALLIIDNCSAHKPIESLRTEDGNICAMFLPPNATALVQPMDQNPIKIVKLKYRNKLLCNIVANETVAIHDMLKKHSLSDAIILLDLAWKELPADILEKSWDRLFKWDDKDYDDDDDIPLSELFPLDNFYREIVNETQQLLSSIAPSANVTAEEINEWNDYVAIEMDDEIESGNDDETLDESDNQNISIPYDEALKSVNKLMSWCQVHTRSSQHMSNLLDLRADIVRTHLAAEQIQKQVTDYFKPQEKP